MKIITYTRWAVRKWPIAAPWPWLPWVVLEHMPGEPDPWSRGWFDSWDQAMGRACELAKGYLGAGGGQPA